MNNNTNQMNNNTNQIKTYELFNNNFNKNSYNLDPQLNYYNNAQQTPYVNNNQINNNANNNFSNYNNNSYDSNNYANAYNGLANGATLIKPPSFTNPNNLLDNNVNENVLLEHNKSHKIFINSRYRNILIFPNPYEFIVSFSGNQGHINKIKLNDYTFYEYINSQINGPFINIGVLNNVISIRVNAIIMPLYHNFIINEDDDIKETDSVASHETLFIVFKNINNDCHSNVNTFNDAFIALKLDHSNLNHTRWVPVSGNDTITFNKSDLRTISNLEIVICDSNGNTLQSCINNIPYCEEYTEKIINNAQKCDYNDKLYNCHKLLFPEILLTINTVNANINKMVNYKN